MDAGGSVFVRPVGSNTGCADPVPVSGRNRGQKPVDPAPKNFSSPRLLRSRSAGLLRRRQLGCTFVHVVAGSQVNGRELLAPAPRGSSKYMIYDFDDG